MLDINIHSSTAPKRLPFADSNVDLGFGKLFTDHMFTSRYSEEKGWSEAQISAYGTLPLEPAASVLHYGQSLFEGLKAFKRKDGSIWLFRPEYNWRRMCDGADRLCLPRPTREIFLGALKTLLELDKRWVPPMKGSSLYIRPTLIGSEGFLGLRPSREALFFTILSPVSSYYAEGNNPIKIWLETKDTRASEGGLGAVKAGANYAASLRASVLAKQKGYSQVLWLDNKHEVIEEVGTMNVFFVFKNEIVSPALNGNILPGCVRDSVLKILRSTESPFIQTVVERRLTVAELRDRYKSGDLLEVFGTGTAAVISSVGQIDDESDSMAISKVQGPVSSWLLETLQGIQWGTVEDNHDWMVNLEDLA